MVKIYKSNNKLILYLPRDVINALNLNEDEAVEFFRLNDKSFLFAKSSDASKLLMGGMPTQNQAQASAQEPSIGEERKGYRITDEDIAVLKKLDTLRFNERNIQNVSKKLSDREQQTLERLMKYRVVSLYKDEKRKEELYSIPKNIYDSFLMRKNMGKPAGRAAPAQKSEPAIAPRYAFRPADYPSNANPENENVKILEKNGFIVLQSESEASSLSSAVEESIRHGMVLGTRSFNKKFYIILRSFFDKNGPRILKEMRNGVNKVPEISRSLDVDEEGVRAILYLMAEQGEVSEKRKDSFFIA